MCIRDRAKLKTVYNRGFSTGFYFGRPLNEWAGVYGSKATKKKIYIGKVKNFYKKIGVVEILVETGKIKIGDTLMFQGPTTGVVEQKVGSMEKKHNKIREAKKGERVAIKTNCLVRENDKVFLLR